MHWLSHRTCGAILFAGLACWNSAPLSATDGLLHLRSEARTQGGDDTPSAAPSPPPPQPSSEHSYGDGSRSYLDDDDDESGLTFETLAVLSVGAVTIASSPFWVPYGLAGDDYATPGYFPRYPYQRPHEGHLMIAPDIPRKPREWVGRAQVDFGGDFDDITQWNGSFLVETTSRFGLDGSARYLQENLPAGHDSLWVGDTNLLFRFAQSPQIEMRAGVGVNWLHDQAGSDAGFNFTYGGDWFPVRPFVVSAELDWGEIAHANLFHGRVTTGVEWHRAEVYVGFDYLDVGQSQFANWIGGFRFWF